MVSATINYKSIRRDNNGAAFGCGIAVDTGAGAAYVVGFPTTRWSYQQAILTALAYAVNSMKPTPKNLVVNCNVKYIKELFEKKEDGSYKIKPKTHGELIEKIRSRVPNLKVEAADPSIIEVCDNAAMSAADANELHWYGHAPCLVSKS